MKTSTFRKVAKVLNELNNGEGLRQVDKSALYEILTKGRIKYPSRILTV